MPGAALADARVLGSTLTKIRVYGAYCPPHGRCSIVKYVSRTDATVPPPHAAAYAAAVVYWLNTHGSTLHTHRPRSWADGSGLSGGPATTGTAVAAVALKVTEPTATVPAAVVADGLSSGSGSGPSSPAETG